MKERLNQMVDNLYKIEDELSNRYIRSSEGPKKERLSFLIELLANARGHIDEAIDNLD